MTIQEKLLVFVLLPLAVVLAIAGGFAAALYGLDTRHAPIWAWWAPGVATVLALISAFAWLVLRQVAVRTGRLETELVRCREVEAALRDGEQRTSGIVNSAMDAIVSVDERQRIVLFNPAAETMFGRQAAAVMGQPLDVLIPARFRAAHAGHIRRFAETGVTMRQMGALGEIRGVRADGEEFPIEAAISQITVAGGRLFTVILRDVTERKRYEERIETLSGVLRGVQQINQLIVREDSRERVVEGACEELVSRGFQGAWLAVLDGAGKLVTAAQAGLGETLDALVGRLQTGDFPACAARALAQRGVVNVHDAWGGLCAGCPLADERRMATALAARLEHGGRVHGVLVVYGEDAGLIAREDPALFQELADDLGLALHKFELEQERHHFESQFLQAQKMEAVGRLAGGIAHDFRNQLTVIGGYCDLLLSQVPADGPLGEQLSEVRSAAHKAETLTNQLLAFSRKQDLHPQVVSLNDVVSGIARPMASLVREDVELSFSLTDRLGTIEVDPAHLEQAVMNLVANARDAMPTGGKLHIETSDAELDASYCRVHPEVAPGTYVMLAVSDTGVGMDSKTLAQVFEPFFTTKEKGKGTGLGLSMVYGFVKQSGGSIFVYSEPGRGTTFKLYFPRADAVAAGIGLRPAPQQTRPAGTETVLLVEDNDSVRGLARQVLEECGYAVIEATDAKQARLLAQHHGRAIDLLLTDVIMPGESGPELAEALLAEHPGLKVLFTSGYTGDAIDRHGLAGPGANLLPKPFGPAALAHAVRQTLDTGNAGAGPGLTSSAM